VLERVGYRGVCTLLGFYLARLLIGSFVGNTSWPERWWLRGPLCGFLGMLPAGIILLGVPGCGGMCTVYNLLSATTIGFVVAGGAWLATARHHA